MFCLTQLFLFFLFFFILYVIRNNNYWKKRNVPFMKPIPIFGNIFEILIQKKQIGEYLWKVYNEYPSERFVGAFFLDVPCLIVRDLELIKHILMKDFKYFHSKVDGIDPKRDPIGYNCLFFSGMPAWKKKRKELSPLFSTGRLISNFNNMNKNSNIMIKSIEKELKNGSCKLNAKAITDKYSINTTKSFFFGIEIDEFTDDNCPFQSLSKGAMNWKGKWREMQSTYIYIIPKLSKIFGFQYFNNSSIRFFRRITEVFIKQRENNQELKNDLIDILIELKNKDGPTDYQSEEGNNLVSHVAQVFVAGYETTSTTMLCTLFELAKHQECQRIAREEAMKIISNYGKLTFDSVKEMKYLRNCFLEAARLYPFEPFLDRKCVEDYKIPGSELILEKGITVFIPSWGIHQDPNIFPNPNQFNPDRFYEEGNVPNFSHLTFGEGPRMCPGKRLATMNTVLGLAKILSSFEIKLPSGAKQKIEVKKEPFVITPKNDIILEFVKLNT